MSRVPSLAVVAILALPPVPAADLTLAPSTDPPPAPSAGPSIGMPTVAAAPVGWASVAGGTTGGAGAPASSQYVVGNRAELKAALANGGDPSGPKIVYVRGVIHGNQADDGRLLTDQDYAPGWDLDKYMACFVDGREWSDDAHPWCDDTGRLRVTGSNNEKAQIQITVPSNTTLVGLGGSATLRGVYLSVNTGTNIIVRNLSIEAPVDYFPAWSPDDGPDGSWNARFDGLSVVTGEHIWIDHCFFSDGAYPDSQAPLGFNGERVQRHDGLLDMEDGTDYVTVSYSQFHDHEKTLLIGSGDGNGDQDTGHLRITFYRNLFQNTSQRSPRIRFGQVHVVNNVYLASRDDPDYPLVSEDLGGSSYFLGMGLESKIYSEYNVFRYIGHETSSDITVANYNGHQFVDHGSWYNGRRADLNMIAARKFATDRARAIAEAEAAGVPPPAWTAHEFTTDVGWDPAGVYDYRPLRSPLTVTRDVLTHSGPMSRN